MSRFGTVSDKSGIVTTDPKVLLMPARLNLGQRVLPGNILLGQLSLMTSSLHGPPRQSCDDVLLRGDEEDDRRQDREGDEGECAVPFDEVFAAELHHAQRPGEQVARVQHDQGQEEVVPALDKDEDADGCENWRRERQSEAPEEADIAAALDVGRLEQLLRQLLEEGLEQEDRQRESECSLGQDHCPITVEQAKVANLDEQWQDCRGEWEDKACQKVGLQHSLAEEANLGEDVGGCGGDDQREQDSHQRDEQRIAHVAPERRVADEPGVEFEMPDRGQAEGIDPANRGWAESHRGPRPSAGRGRRP